MTKDDENNPAGKQLPPGAAEAMKRGLFFGAGSAPSPSDGRFKKGQSGNPGGRPRRVREQSVSLDPLATNALFLREAQRLVSVRDGESVVQVSLREAIVRSQLMSAAKGNAYAQKHALERMDRADYADAHEIARSNAFWEDYCDRRRAEIEQARRKGEPLPAPLPHPDDIIIEPGKRVHIHGPLDEGEAERLNETCRLRDTLIIQDAFEWKLFEAGSPKPDADKPGGAALYAYWLNDTLPRRLQLSQARIEFDHMRYGLTSNRELLKRLHQAWRALGFPAPRGWTMPPLAEVQPQVECLGALIAGVSSGKLDLAAIARGEFDEKAQELLGSWI